MSYGLNVAGWDVLLSDVVLDMFAKQVGIVNRERNHTASSGTTQAASAR